ncbi:hypothetical protein GCM10010377_04210 [Streptomyces viridiviolaceus]|nr:hypothetical protein GCM10010377_04210 [Streptomyces viridiviolaceus]
MADFLVALGARDQPTVQLAGPDLVLGAVAAHGRLRDIDQPSAAATDLTFTSHISLGELPPLIQDANPCFLAAAADEEGPAGCLRKILREARGTWPGIAGQQNRRLSGLLEMFGSAAQLHMWRADCHVPHGGLPPQEACQWPKLLFAMRLF